MTIYTVDTAAAVRKLKESGCAEPLAEAIVGLVAERQEEFATKTAIAPLRTDIELLKNYLLNRIILAQIAGAGLVFALIKLFGV